MSVARTPHLFRTDCAAPQAPRVLSTIGNVQDSDNPSNFLYTLSDAEFAKFVTLTEEWTGVRLKEGKRSMLLARLGIRIRHLQMRSVAEYLKYLVSDRGQADEKEHFVDVVTTHHTAFFRESEHFTVLSKEVVQGFGSQGGVRVLSAACSTGEELWSIGMTLAEGFGHLRFELHGADISRRALQAARRGIYSVETTSVVPETLRRRWFMRSRDRDAELVRVVPELRERAGFSVINLTIDPPGIVGKYDVVFLRNVLIYFDREMQQQILRRVIEHVVPNGWFFVGLSETADGFGLPLNRLGHSVYRRVA